MFHLSALRMGSWCRSPRIDFLQWYNFCLLKRYVCTGMHRLKAYFFLGVIINIVLFHPLETMQSDIFLTAPDPINSLTELVMEVCLDIQDNQPGDERESESEHFSSAIKLFSSFKNANLLIRQNLMIAEIANLSSNAAPVLKVFISINNPPPEA